MENAWTEAFLWPCLAGGALMASRGAGTVPRRCSAGRGTGYGAGLLALGLGARGGPYPARFRLHVAPRR
eukprot:9932714-Lingulodinium_polyedra.AAC.1